MDTKVILDKVHAEVKRYCWFDRPEKYDIASAWPIGSYFLKYGNGDDGIKILKRFPYLGFVSPEPDSGKSQALKLMQRLAYNSIDAGTYSEAALFHLINQSKDKRTIVLDELDKIFRHGKDNDSLIRMFNQGYEDGAIIGRMNRSSNEILTIDAYCPKVFAALAVAKIPEDTKTRIVFINCSPKDEDVNVEEDFDEKALRALNAEILSWHTSIIERLRDIDISYACNILHISNRNKQIFSPLLAIYKLGGADWYARGINVVRYFTKQQDTINTLYHKIIRGIYIMWLTRDEPKGDKIHRYSIEEKLHEMGLPVTSSMKQFDNGWVDLGDVLKKYDDSLLFTQTKINDLNRSGIAWRLFEPTFKTYIKAKERSQIARELGLVAEVAEVGVGGGTDENKTANPSRFVTQVVPPTATSATGTTLLSKSKDVKIDTHIETNQEGDTMTESEYDTEQWNKFRAGDKSALGWGLKDTDNHDIKAVTFS